MAGGPPSRSTIKKRWGPRGHAPHLQKTLQIEGALRATEVHCRCATPRHATTPSLSLSLSLLDVKPMLYPCLVKKKPTDPPLVDPVSLTPTANLTATQL